MSSTTVFATGGGGGGSGGSGTKGFGGGTFVSNVGTTTFTGGNGAPGVTGTAGQSGGGGGGAGSTGNGGTTSTTTAGVGTSVGGGDGGAGIFQGGLAGNTGGQFGGGGSGARRTSGGNTTGGVGGGGQAQVTYTVNLTRLYLQNAAPTYEPPTLRQGWVSTANYVPIQISTTKSGSGASVTAPVQVANGTLFFHAVTPPLASAVTLSNKINLVIGTQGPAASNNRFSIYAYVTAGSTDTVRGTIISGTLFTNTFSTTAQGFSLDATTTPSNVVSAQAGDRIVFEIGAFTSPSPNGTMYYGGTGSDLTIGDTNVTTDPGYIEFAQTLSFDTTGPTPDPPIFDNPSGLPTPVSASSITASTTIETDAANNPTSYYFGVTSTGCGSDFGTGGTDSGWQSSQLYTDTGLQPNQCYGFLARARDAALNETGTSTTASTTYTFANVPGAPTLGSASATTLTLTNAENSNPSSNPTTNFAVQITSSDSSWNNMYVKADGTQSASAVWLTDAQLDGLVITGLTSSTDYTAQVKARNQNSVETAFSSTGTGTTNPTIFGSARIIRIKGGTRIKGGVRLR